MGRSIFISLGLLIIAAAASVGVCRAVGCDPHPVDLGLAAVICLLALLVGIAPTFFMGGASVTATFQAALIGSVLHMVSSLILACAAIAGLRRGNVFVYWMLTFYWLTLIEMLVMFVTHMRTQERLRSAAL